MEAGPKGWFYVNTPTQEQWNRFYLYSSKVRRAKPGGWLLRFWAPGIFNGVNRPLSKAAVDILTSPSHSAGGPLFPTLRAWGWQDDESNDTFCISSPNDIITSHIFLQSRLVEVCVSIANNATMDDLVQDFLTQLKHHCPHMKSLTLYFDRVSPNIQQSAFLLSGFSKLEVFGLHTRNGRQGVKEEAALVAVLSRLPALKKLTLSSLYLDNLGEDVLEVGGFCALQYLAVGRLQINADKPTPICKINTPAQLRELIGCTYNSRIFKLLLEAMIARNVDIHCLRFDIMDKLTVEDTQLFTSFRHLRRLRLDGMSDFQLMDDDIKYLAQNLPSLQQLAFEPIEWPSHTNITLLSIQHIVMYCLEIEEILFTLDATIVPALIYSWDQKPAPRCCALSINVRCSRINDARAVASWLKNCCRGFDDVTIHWNRLSSGRDEWAKVEQLLLL